MTRTLGQKPQRQIGASRPINNLFAAIYRAKDKSEHAGRPLWRGPATILDRRRYLKADIPTPSHRQYDGAERSVGRFMIKG